MAATPGRKKISWGDIRQLVYRGKYTDKELTESLKRVLGDKIIGESQNYLCIPSYNVTSGKPRVFKKDFGTQINTDDKARYVDIALATSAAPTFFPMAEIPHFNNKQFVDGGVWANNPTLMGLIEALRFLSAITLINSLPLIFFL